MACVEKMRCLKIWSFVCIGVGIVFIIVGGTLGGLWFKIIDQIVASQLELTPSSQSFQLWHKVPFPIYMDIYFFNWTNPEKTMKNKEKPHFVEVGPYVYRTDFSKLNIHWNHNGTVTFQQARTWYFEPSLSKGALTDNITNINVIAMTIGALVKKYVKDWELPIVNELLKHEESIVSTHTVHELLFDGCDDNFLIIAKKLKRFIKIELPMDKFGWFYNRNSSKDFDGVFNMFTGSTSPYDLGLLNTWNYNSKVSAFKDTCGNIKGTTGELWPLHSSRKNELDFFIGDICSSFKMINKGEGKYNGLTGNRFVGNEINFNNKTSDGQTSCYCVEDPCQPSGTRGISSCRYGVPGYISYPHFYLADPSYINNIEGMKPSKDDHEFYMLIEQKSSVPVDVSAKLQFSIFVEPIKGLKFFKNLPTAFLPQLWFNQRAALSEKYTSQLAPLAIVYNLGQPLFFTICGVGVILFCLGIFLFYRYRAKKHHNSILNNHKQ